MSNETKTLAIVPRTIDEVHSLAEVLAKSSLMPDALRNKVPDVVVSILAGQELGLSPMAAIRGVHVVQGKPVLSADTMVALILGSGLAEYFSCIEDTDTRVTYETKRKGSPHVAKASWSTEDTKRAGLQSKDNWRLYTRAMMKARAKAALARDTYPDVLAGCYDPDEIAVPISATRQTPAVVEAVDAEIVSEEPGLIAQIEQAEGADLDALVPKINKLIKGSPERVAAMAAYKARKASLETPTPQEATAP